MRWDEEGNDRREADQVIGINERRDGCESEPREQRKKELSTTTSKQSKINRWTRSGRGEAGGGRGHKLRWELNPLKSCIRGSK